jgi:hypothetical protein
VVGPIRLTWLLFIVVLCLGAASQIAACGSDDSATEARIARERREAATLARQEERIKQLQREARQLQKKDGSSGAGSGAAGTSGSQAAPAMKDCGAVSANSVTTCGFAQNVKNAYFSSGGASHVTVHSDATGRDYDMSCSGGSPHICTGGNGAEVRFD